MKTEEEIRRRIRALNVRLSFLTSDSDDVFDLDVEDGFDEASVERTTLLWVLNN